MYYPLCVVLIFGSICAIVFSGPYNQVSIESIFSFTIHPPLPHLCVRWCQRWCQEKSARWEENGVLLWFACSTFTPFPVLSCHCCEFALHLHECFCCLFSISLSQSSGMHLAKLSDHHTVLCFVHINLVAF